MSQQRLIFLKEIVAPSKATNLVHKRESDRTLSILIVTHIINAPFEKLDIADWLFNLPDAEYQRCSHAHIAAGHATSDVL